MSLGNGALPIISYTITWYLQVVQTNTVNRINIEPAALGIGVCLVFNYNHIVPSASDSPLSTTFRYEKVSCISTKRQQFATDFMESDF